VSDPPAGGRERVARAALYAGGFLGPFGGGVLVVLIPELQAAFHATAGEVTAGLTVYLLPFAGLQLVSGTIGERLGHSRTIRWAFLAYALSSFAVALAPSIVPFLVLRAVQGASNAFTSPLLLASLAESTSEEHLGRSMGTFASMQTAGMVIAPLCGGLLGAIEPRLAFAVPGVAGLLLAAAPQPRATGKVRETPARLRDAFNKRSTTVATAGFLAFLAINGVAFLVALRSADAFGLDATERGLLLAGFGFAGVLAGRPAGGLVDRSGPRPVVIFGALACAVMVAGLGLAGTIGGLAAAWLIAGAGSSFIWAGLNTLAVQSAPANRGGAISVVGAFKFTGNAIAPLLWLPLYEERVELAFGTAAVACAAIVLVVLSLGGGPRRVVVAAADRARAAAAAHQ
jgi:MFS family permease